MSELSTCLNVFLRLRRTRTIFCCCCFENKVKGEQTVLNAIFWQNSEQPYWLSEEPDIHTNLAQGLKKLSCWSQEKSDPIWPSYINSPFVEKYQRQYARSLIHSWGKEHESIMPRPQGELLSHTTSQASSDKSLCLVNLAAAAEDGAASSCPPATV